MDYSYPDAVGTQKQETAHLEVIPGNENDPSEASANGRSKRNSLTWRWFLAFVTVVTFSKKTSVRVVTYVMLYLDIAFLVTFYLVLTATHGEPNEIIKYIMLAFEILSGLQTTAVLVLSVPFLFPSRFWWIVFLDFVAWALLVTMGCGMLLGFVRVTNGTQEEERRWISALGFLLVVRLNTFLAFNVGLDSLDLTSNATSTPTERRVGVPIIAMTELVAQSKLSESCKQILDNDLRRADIDADGILDSLEFFYFLHGSTKRNILWQAPCSKNKEAYEALLTKMDFDSLVPEENVPFLHRDANNDEGILSIMTVASKLLFDSQKLLGVSVILALCVGAVAQPAFVLLVGKQVNLAVEMAAMTTQDEEFNDARHQFILGIIGLIGLWLVDEASWYLSCYLGARLISNATARVQLGLAKCALFSGIEFEDKYNPGALSNVFSSSISKAEQVWHQLIYRFVRPLASLVSAVVFLALFDVSYAFFVVSAFPLIASFHFLEIQATNCSAEADASSARLLGRFQNTVNIQLAAKVCNSESFVLGRFKDLLKPAQRDNFKTFAWSNVVEAIFTTVGYGLNMITTVVFLFELADGHLSAGEFFSVTGFVLGVVSPIEAIGTFSGEVARMSGAIQKINTVLTDGKESKNPGDSKKGGYHQSSLSLDKELTLENVRFSYGPNLPLVLKEVSISVASGSYVCFLGPSGCGKSTLLYLLTGTRTCTSGRILMDGVDVSTVPLQCLRDSLAVVFQDISVLDGTIFDNIAFGCIDSEGNLNQAHEVVAIAAKEAGIHEFIETLPEKYDTVIGEEATISLSGGQLQRICGVARALARRPKLLILDEATSALDKISERLIVKSLERLCDDGLTIVSVTHHPATAKNADEIIILDQGFIAQRGTYNELYSRAGLFSSLIEADRRRSCITQGGNDEREGFTIQDDVDEQECEA